MTSRPGRGHGPEPRSAGVVPAPALPAEEDVGAAAEDGKGHDAQDGRLAYSVEEAARLTGLSRDLLYDEMRRGNLAYVKVGRRRLITRRHLQQFLGIAS